MARRTERRQSNLRSIVVNIIPSDIKYNIVVVPRKHRLFVPPYKILFDFLRNNARTRPAWMSSSYRGVQVVGDEEDGQYIVGRLREWYDNNNVQVGDRAKITRLEKVITPGRLAYRLTHLSSR